MCIARLVLLACVMSLGAVSASADVERLVQTNTTAWELLQDDSDGGFNIPFAQSASSFVDATRSAQSSAAAGVSFLHVSAEAHSQADNATTSALATSVTQNAFTVVPTDALGDPLVGTAYDSGTLSVEIDRQWVNLVDHFTTTPYWQVMLGGQTFSLYESDSGGSQTLSVTVPWSAGQPIDVFLLANASTGVGPNAASGFGDEEMALQWGGITGVFDQLGQPIDHFTALGADGATD